MDDRYGDSVFNQDHADESARLNTLGDVYDESTRRRLKKFGVQPGMRCLDLGAGPGTITSWLADQLPASEIVAVDRDTRMLEPLADRHPNLRIEQLDVTNEPDLLALGRFDFVHIRFVLMHLRSREEVLRRLVSMLVPGGGIVVSDTIDLTTANSPHLPYREAMGAMWDTLRERIGTDVTWVRETPVMLQKAGLCEVGSEVYIPAVSDPPVARFWWMSLREIRPMLLDRGLIGPDTLQDALAALEDPDFTELAPGMITTWGRAAS